MAGNVVSGGPTAAGGFNYGGVSAPTYQDWLRQYMAANPSAAHQQANVVPYSTGPQQAVQATAVGRGAGGGAGRTANAYASPSPYLSNPQAAAYGYYGSQPAAGGQATQQQATGAFGTQAAPMGYPQQPTGGAQGGTAQVGSLVGQPMLPNSQNMLQNYPISQANMTLSQTGGPEYLARQYGPSAAQGMLPSASTEAMIAPMLADRSANARLAQNQSAFDMANQNANAMLNWQALQAGSDIGQFGNLADLNNLQQNYNVGLYGNNVNFNNDLLGIKTRMLAGMMGGIGGMTGSLIGGATGGLGGLLGGSDPTGVLGGASDPTSALAAALGGGGDQNGLLASILSNSGLGSNGFLGSLLG